MQEFGVTVFEFQGLRFQGSGVLGVEAFGGFVSGLGF